MAEPIKHILLAIYYATTAIIAAILFSTATQLHVHVPAKIVLLVLSAVLILYSTLELIRLYMKAINKKA